MKDLFQLTIVLFSILLIHPSCDQLKDKGHDGIKPLDKTQISDNNGQGDLSTRLEWQKPEFVIESLGNLSDKIVADIGAESGYFTFRLAKRAKKVIAIEIDPKMIELIELFKENISNDLQSKIETRKALPNDPKLVDGEVDVALIINTLGYIDDKIGYLKKVKRGLSDDGVLFVIDFKNTELPNDIALSTELIIDSSTLQSYLEAAGFEVVRANTNALPYQYMIWAFK